MLTTEAVSSSNHHSPTTPATTNGPDFPRNNLPSPWAQVVRGAGNQSLQHEEVALASSSSSSLASTNSDVSAVDNTIADNKNNASNPERTAWKNPSSGVAEVIPVMGAVSWPALSESANPSAKSTSDSSIEGSLSNPQGPVTAPQPPQKQAASSGNAKPTPPMNYCMPNRPRSMKHGGGNGNGSGSGPVQNSFSNPYPILPISPPPYPMVQIPPPTFGNGVPGPLPRDPHRNNGWDARSPIGGFGPPVNEHRNPPRRGNFGNHPRGAGGHHNNNYGYRRGPNRGNYTPNTRDVHPHQQSAPQRGYMRSPPPSPASFIGPQPLQSFLNPAGFHEVYYFPTVQMEPFGGMPFLTHSPPPAIVIPVPEEVAETPSPEAIIKQIDYYFSDANLVKDEFLRYKMDEHGWVPIELIANFPKVKKLTEDIELILNLLGNSSNVEVQGKKLRRRNDWMKWLLARNDSSSTSAC